MGTKICCGLGAGGHHDRENDFLDGNTVEHRLTSRGQLATPARSGGKKRAGGRKS